MADPLDRRARAVAYIQEARRARGFPPRRPTAEEIEQRELFRFETALSGWVTGRSTLLRQHREAFAKECTGPWRPDAFALWLPADAKAAMCADLARLRAAFVQELEAASDMDVAPNTMAAIMRVVGEFVRRAQSRRHPQDYSAALSKAKDEARRRVMCVHDPLRKAAAALRCLDADDPLLSHELLGVRWLLEDTTLGHLLEAHGQGAYHDPFGSSILGDGGVGLTEAVASALHDLAQRLADWAPSSQRPIARRLLDQLARIYELASRRRAVADWSSTSDKPVGPFSRFLVTVYEALPREAQCFAATRPAAFAEKAKKANKMKKAKAAGRE